jgi:uncharacterized RDD family membrane protein YckC
MPRAPREEVAGGVFHVSARGDDRRPIFIDQADHDLYVSILTRVIRKTGWRCGDRFGSPTRRAVGATMEDATDVLGRRIGAALLDLVVLFVLLIVVGVIFGEDETSGGSVSVTLEGASALVWIVVALLYYGVSEATSGQTLGKRLLAIRVVRLDGHGRPGAGAIAARTVLRIVDGFLFYLVGLIAILATGARRQRVGDLAAGTTVAGA